MTAQLARSLCLVLTLVGLTPVAASAQDEAANALTVQLNHPDGEYRDGEVLSVTVEIGQPCNVYILYHQTDGNAVLLFPNIDRRDSRLTAPGTYELPGPDDEIQCVIRGPFEQEVVQVVATLTPIADLEKALANEGDRVAVIKTETVDELCGRHAQTEGLAEARMPVTSPEAN